MCGRVRFGALGAGAAGECRCSVPPTKTICHAGVVCTHATPNADVTTNIGTQGADAEQSMLKLFVVYAGIISALTKQFWFLFL